MTATALTPPPDDLRARQLAAIEDSGWGQRFRLFQPRNAMFWVYVWAVAVGIGHTLRYYVQDVATYGGALAAGGVAFAIYGGLWLAFLGAANRYTPLSPRLLAAAFFWGFFAATAALALQVNGAMLTLYPKLFGQAWAQDWSAGLTAPFTEEVSKALGLVVLLGLASRLIRSAYDAFVVGAFIGLGFQIWENVLYVYQGAEAGFGANETGAVVQIIALRSITGLASHALFSAIVCTGLFWILGKGAERRQVGKGLGLVVIAMVCHGLWDSIGAIGPSLFGSRSAASVLMPLFLIGEIAILLYVARLASTTEHTWMHDLLAPEVANGTLTADEVGGVAGSRWHQRKYLKTIHGRHERRTAKHVLAAAHDLAEAITRADGAEDGTVSSARAEINRLRTL